MLALLEPGSPGVHPQVQVTDSDGLPQGEVYRRYVYGRVLWLMILERELGVSIQHA